MGRSQLKVFVGKGSGFTVPAEMTIREVGAVQEDLLTLLGRKNKRFELQMGSVVRIDTAAVQVLLSAKRTAEKAGRHIEFIDPSERCLEVTRQLGLDHDLFGQP